jgi:hypothetical protein
MALAVLCAPTAALSVDDALVDAHLIVAAEAQLESDDVHLMAHEQVEVVGEVRNCIPAVRAALDAWVDRLKLTPTRTLVKDTQVRWVVDVDSPKPGFVVVNYRVFPARRKAHLEVLFDSGFTLSAQEKERVVTRYDLVRLKRTLVNEMKCAQ